MNEVDESDSGLQDTSSWDESHSVAAGASVVHGDVMGGESVWSSESGIELLFTL